MRKCELRNNLYDDLLFVLFIQLGQIPNCKFCSIIIPPFLLLLLIFLLFLFFCVQLGCFSPLPIHFAYMGQKCVNVNRNMVGTVEKKALALLGLGGQRLYAN